MEEVAEMVGFNDTATFHKRFMEQYGTTPSQYGPP
ncbi:AraC family transcriptional regulator [Parabacteroides segnis]